MTRAKPAPMQIGESDLVGVCLLLPRRMRTWLRLAAARATDEEHQRVTQAAIVRRLIEADPVYALYVATATKSEAAK